MGSLAHLDPSRDAASAGELRRPVPHGGDGRLAREDLLDERRLTPRVRRLPLDLFRNEVLMTRRPVPRRAIRSLVDEVLVPLLTRRA
jgi:hypothetical protein